MNFNQIVATAAIGCTLGGTGIALGSGTANAAPPTCPTGVQCGPGGHPGAPPPGDIHPPGSSPEVLRGQGDHDWRPPWTRQDNDWHARFQGAPWGEGLPPWGWGAPPPPLFDGPLPPAVGPPPPPINYFGFDEQPVWDAAYNQWGFWFFGIWIPLPV